MYIQQSSLRYEIRKITDEIHAANIKAEAMLPVFMLEFILIAIAVILAPIVYDFFAARREDRDIDRRIEKKIDEILTRRLN